LLLASAGGGDGTWRLWDVATRQLLLNVRGLDLLVNGVAISADGATVLSADDGSMRRWDLKRRRQAYTLSDRSRLETVGFSPDGQLAWSGSGSGIRVFDTATWNLRCKLTASATLAPGLGLSRDGHSVFAITSRGTNVRWDIDDAQPVRVERPPEAALDPAGGRAAFFSNGSRAVVTSENNLLILDTQTGQTLQTLTGHRNRLESLAVSPDGHWAVSSSLDHTVKFWDLGRLKEVGTFNTSDVVGGVHFSRDGNVLLLADSSPKVTALDLRRPAEFRRFEQELVSARQLLEKNPADPAGLEALGGWYTYRGQWAWAGELLKRARSAGAHIPSLQLARCDWQLGDKTSAKAEFQAAVAAHEAPEWYLSWCLKALDSGAENWVVPEAVAAFGEAHWICCQSLICSDRSPPFAQCFRKEFNIGPDDVTAHADLCISTLNNFSVYVNGREVPVTYAGWALPGRLDISSKLVRGRNVIAVRANTLHRSLGPVESLILRLSVPRRSSPPLVITSNGAWKALQGEPPRWDQLDFDDSKWSNAIELGKLPTGPWKYR